VTRGWLPQRAGSPSLNGGGTAAAVSPAEETTQLAITVEVAYIHKPFRTSWPALWSTGIHRIFTIVWIITTATAFIGVTSIY